MRRVGLISHPDCDLHDHPGHPESAQRTVAILNYINSGELQDKLTFVSAQPCSREQLLLNHDEDYVNLVKQACRQGQTALDPDTYINPASYDAALLSYGGALQAVDMVMEGSLDRAFCLLRPPGHHASPGKSKGFCLFNNIAGAARWAQEQHGLERIAIIDFDGHHGNGTQDSFYYDPTVHYTSTHQYPFYPGTGAANERGRGAGEGFTLNLPLRAGENGQTAVDQLQEHWLPAMADFKPELVLVSAGFDAHRLDPLVMLAFEDEDYLRLTRLVCGVADQYCHGRVVSLLEGGYHLEALARSVGLHLKGLLDE